MTPFSSEWWTAVIKTVNEDDRFSEAAKHFHGRIEIVAGRGSHTVEVSGGKLLDSSESASPREADIILRAPDSEWDRIARAETDFMKATTPGLGTLQLEGDAALAMNNIRVVALLLKAMSAGVQTPPVARSMSPDPRPSGQPTIGRYVEVDGLRTYYEEAGSGKALVCFHAACQDTLMYRYVLDGLSDQYRVIALDAPGHVKTDMPPSGPFTNLTTHAEFNEQFMAQLELDRPAILGCSMGGNLVLELASRRPDYYSAVVSVCGADYTPTMSDFLLEMLLSNGQQIVETFAESLTGPRTPEDRAREAVWQIRRNVPEVMAADLAGYAGFDKRDEVKQIESPVLLLRGEADWLVYQEQVEATRDRIPGSELEVLAGTGHYPMIENPYEFNETVRAFLQRHHYI